MIKRPQTLFNKVVRHLGKQRKKSYDDSVGTCLYRGPNGTKCAIGCLIKDEYYTDDLEMELPGQAGIDNALHQSGVDSVLLDELLCCLQDIHDNHRVCDWRHQLKRLAIDNNLNTKAVDEAFSKGST